jgi:hypothetical protein
MIPRAAFCSLDYQLVSDMVWLVLREVRIAVRKFYRSNGAPK